MCVLRRLLYATGYKHYILIIRIIFRSRLFWFCAYERRAGSNQRNVSLVVHDCGAVKKSDFMIVVFTYEWLRQYKIRWENCANWAAYSNYVNMRVCSVVWVHIKYIWYLVLMYIKRIYFILASNQYFPRPLKKKYFYVHVHV